MPRRFSGSMADSRVCISRAALLVKVTAMILAAMARWLAISQAMRVVSTRFCRCRRRPAPAPSPRPASLRAIVPGQAGQMIGKHEALKQGKRAILPEFGGNDRVWLPVFWRPAGGASA